MSSSLNTFQLQSALYLGVQGPAQPLISYTGYTPTITGEFQITVNTADGFSADLGSLGVCWGTVDASIGAGDADAEFNVSFPTSFFSQVPAAVVSVNGSTSSIGDVITAYASDTMSSDITIRISRSVFVGGVDLKISWVAFSQ